MSIKWLLVLSLVAVAASSPAPTFPILGLKGHGGVGLQIGALDFGKGLKSLFGTLIGHKHLARNNLEDILNLKISSFNDVCGLLPKVVVSLTDTIEASIKGLGSLLSRVILSLLKVTVCFLGGAGKDNPICKADINALVGVKVAEANDALGVINLFGLTDCKVKLNSILALYTKGKGISSCRGSVLVVFRLAQELVERVQLIINRSSGKLTKSDFTFCFHRITKLLGAIGNSRQKGLGLQIVQNFVPVCNKFIVQAGFPDFGALTIVQPDIEIGNNDRAPWAIPDIDASANTGVQISLGGIIGNLFKGLVGVTRLASNLVQDIIGIVINSVEDVFSLGLKIILGLGGLLDATISGLGSLLVRIIAGLLKIVLCFLNLGGKYGVCKSGWDRQVGINGDVTSIDLVIKLYGLSGCRGQVEQYIKTYTKGAGIDSTSGSIKILLQSSLTLSQIIEAKKWDKNTIVIVFRHVTYLLGAVGNSNAKGVGTSVCNKFIPACDKYLTVAGFPGFGSNQNDIITIIEKANDDNHSWSADIVTGNDDKTGFINVGGNNGGKPEGGKPEGGKPEGGKPGQPEGGKPEGGKPGKPEGGKPEGGKPGKPEGGKPEGGKPGKPEGGKPEGGKPGKPEGGKPEGGKPGKPEGGKPEGGKPGKPEGGKPGKPEGGKPEGGKPGKPEGGKPEGGKPGKPEGGKPEGGKPGKPEGGKPGKPEGGKPEGGKPGKPEGGKSEGGKPGKPEGGKPEGGKPGKPEGGKPEGGKPGKPEGGKPEGGKPGKPEGGKPGKPEGGKPEGGKPGKPEGGKPEGGKPGKPEGGKPGKPEGGKPEGGKPGKPEGGKPEGGKPGKPEGGKPEGGKPGKPEGGKPGKPEGGKPEGGKPGKPEGGKPEGGKPGKPEGGKPEGGKPGKPEGGKPEGGKPGKPEGGKPEGGKPGKPEGGKPEGGKPGKPEGGKPEGGKPGKPEGGKPEGGKPGKPEGGKPEGGKPGKPEGGKPGKPEGGKPEGGKPGKPEGGKPEGGKQEGGKPTGGNTGISLGGSGIIGGLLKGVFGTIAGVTKVAFGALDNILKIKIAALNDVFTLVFNLSIVLQATLNNIIFGLGSLFARLTACIIKIGVCVNGFPGDKGICNKGWNAKFGINGEASTAADLIVLFRLNKAQDELNGYITKFTKGKGIDSTKGSIRIALNKITTLITFITDIKKFSRQTVTDTFVILTTISGSVCNSRKRDSGKEIIQKIIPVCGKFFLQQGYPDITVKVTVISKECDTSNGDNIDWNGGKPTPAPGGDKPTPAPGGDKPTPAPGGDKPTPAPGGDKPTPAPGGDQPTPAPGGDQPTPAPGGDKPTPAPGGDQPTPAPGGDQPTPAPGGDKPTPAPGGDKPTPAPGGDKPTPAPGGDQPTPAPGGDQPTPAPGGDKPTPAPGGDKPTPAPGGDQPTPAPGGDKPTPAPGGDQPTPAPGDDQPTPAPGGDKPTPAPGGDQPTPAPGGDQPTPAPGGDQPTPAPGGDQPTPATPAPGGNNGNDNNCGEIIGNVIQVIPGVTSISTNIINEIINIKINAFVDVINLVTKLTLALGGIIDSIVSGLGSLLIRIVAVIFKIGYCVNGFGSDKSICTKEWNAQWGITGDATTAVDLIALFRLNNCKSDLNTIISTFTNGKGISSTSGLINIILQKVLDLSVVISSGSITKESFSSVFINVISIFGSITNSYKQGSGTVIIQKVIPICGVFFVKQGLPDITVQQKTIVSTINLGNKANFDWTVVKNGGDSKSDQLVTDVKKVFEGVQANNDVNKPSVTAVLNLQPPRNFDDVCSFGVQVVQGLGGIVDLFINGLGTLISRIVGALINYIVAILGASRNAKSFVSQKAYYNSFGVTVSGSSWDAIAAGFKINNCQADLDGILKAFTNNKGRDSLSGVQKVLFDVAYDLVSIVVKGKGIVEGDLTVVFKAVTTLLGGFANSCSANIGKTICDNMLPTVSFYLEQNNYPSLGQQSNTIYTTIDTCNGSDAPWASGTTTVVTN